MCASVQGRLDESKIFHLAKRDISNVLIKQISIFQRNMLLPLILQMEGASSYETSVLVYQTAVCYIPEDYSLNGLEL